MTVDAVVKKNDEAHRFEIATDAGLAVLNYHESPRHITLVHTEVPPPLEGRGYASTLARAALEYARGAGLRVIAKCPFVRQYLERHPQYADLTKAEP